VRVSFERDHPSARFLEVAPTVICDVLINGQHDSHLISRALRLSRSETAADKVPEPSIERAGNRQADRAAVGNGDELCHCRLL
jgi:hypothetical protein